MPFEFPVVSNGGNDIIISRSKNDSTLTVKFWIFRNFFDSPSKNFIYSNNKNSIEWFEKKIKENPQRNWKIKENWYRIYGE